MFRRISSGERWKKSRFATDFAISRAYTTKSLLLVSGDAG